MAQTVLQPKKAKPAPRRWLKILGGFLAVCFLAVLGWMMVDWLTFRPTGDIAYECHRYGTGYIDICIIDADGRNQRRFIQFEQSGAVSPTWSPDGKRLAFVSDARLYVIDYDGSNLTEVISNIVESQYVSWSPRENRILIWVEISGKAGLYAVNPDPNDLAPLYIAPAIPEYPFPVEWHPNGNEIFARMETDSPVIIGPEVVRFTLPDLTQERLGFSCSGMAINPDGKTLACRQDLRSLILRDISTGTNKTITNWSILLSGVRSPAWSPDGHYIVYFQTHWPAFLDDRNGELWIMRADGSHPTKLTNGGGDRNPAWRPQP